MTASVKFATGAAVIAVLLSFAPAAQRVKPDLDYAFMAFSCLGDICKTKAGVLPQAWRRYGQYKDRTIWD